ncbi:MAG: hypothetical protein ACLFQV_05225, partial [Vulcanimicrobiota bacterium]
MYLILLTILSILAQNTAIFLFFWLLLSIWDIPYIYPLVITSLSFIFQLFFSYNAISLFFRASPPEFEQNETTIKNRKMIQKIMKKLNLENADLFFFQDDIPMILSLGHFMGKKALVISDGLLLLCTEQELDTLITREAWIQKKGLTGLSTIAGFIPFVINALIHWFFESAKMSQARKGSGAPQLAGLIAEKFNVVTEFVLLFTSQYRHKKADEYLFSKEKIETRHFQKAIRKIGLDFIKPVRQGPKFRKRIFQGLRFLLPFDPIQFKILKQWQLFLESEHKIEAEKIDAL